MTTSNAYRSLFVECTKNYAHITQHLFLKCVQPHLQFEIHNRQTVHFSPDFPPRQLIVLSGFTVFKFDNILELQYYWLVSDYTVFG